MQVRCPRCNKFGKASLGGYCQPCKDARRKPNYVMRDLMKGKNGIRTGDALPNTYGIMREKFGIEEKDNGGQI
jgi:hypothetical protein